jgi:hypothetical protein
MKKAIIILCALFVTLGAFSLTTSVKSGIHGTIEPADAAGKVTAISGNDSMSTVPVSGKFSLPVKPGNWTLVIEAVQPYRSTTVENILVLENQSTDAGAIKLQK